jgi:hypothetical protein
MWSRLRRVRKEFIVSLGPDYIGPRRYGKWCVVNFLWNTMPWKRKDSLRFKVQLWLYWKLRPILSPERTYPEGGS